MNPSPVFRALVLSCLAIALWIMVALFAWFIGSAQAQDAQAVREGAMHQTQEESLASAHALVAATSLERAQLQSLMQPDALSIADMFTSAGQQAGVDLQVSDASPESSAATSSVSAIDFTVKASGAFPKLADALALIEEMPAPASIQAFDLDLIPDAGSGASGSDGPWQLVAHVRVLTAAPLSP